jgi:hypothetical protein
LSGKATKIVHWSMNHALQSRVMLGVLDGGLMAEVVRQTSWTMSAATPAEYIWMFQECAHDRQPS